VFFFWDRESNNVRETCFVVYLGDDLRCLFLRFPDSTVKQEGSLQDAPIEVIHLLLTSLFKCKDNFGIGTEQKEVFIRTLKKGKINHIMWCSIKFSIVCLADLPFEVAPMTLGHCYLCCTFTLSNCLSCRLTFWNGPCDFGSLLFMLQYCIVYFLSCRLSFWEGPYNFGTIAIPGRRGFICREVRRHIRHA
jgi:hypothetical protein